MKSKCPRCGRKRQLTKHSLKGGHKPPFVRVCLECHRRLHGQNINAKGKKFKAQQKNPVY